MESGALKIDDINEGIVSSGKVGDGLYVVCIGVNAPALLYNKTLLDEAGIEVKDQMTIDEFVALSKEIYEKTAYKTNLGYGTDMVLGYILRGYGVDLLKDGKLNITAEDAEKIFTLYAQGISEGWMLGSEVFAETSVGTVEQDPMIYGSAPEYMSWCALFWSNQVTAMQAAAPEGVGIGITTWPSPDPVKSNYLKPSQFFSVAAKTQHPHTAVASWTSGPTPSRRTSKHEKPVTPCRGGVTRSQPLCCEPGSQRRPCLGFNTPGPNCAVKGGESAMAQPTVIRPRKALADKLNEAHIAGMICTAPFTIGFLLFIIVPMLIDPSSSSDYGAMFAMSTLSILPVVIIFITLQKYLVEGIVTTGLKG